VSGPDAASLTLRRRAVGRALGLLHAIARRESTFERYSGHLLLAFCLIGTTSRSAAIRRQALEMGYERARYWKKQWPHTRRGLDADTVMHEVIASYAVERMGIGVDRIRRDLQTVLDRYTPRDLLYFDPSAERAPADVPEDCPCGHVSERGRTSCRACRKRLGKRSRYEVWYYALTTTYFCERQGVASGARFADVMGQLPGLRPYPRPGSRHYYDSIYAVTHLVYTLNDYGRSRLSPRRFPHELRFLKACMRWALEQGEPDTVGEIIDTLAALGVDDADPLLVKGRAFLLAHQRDDGGWGEEGDDYRQFHHVWAAIDGLRDYRWRPERFRRRGMRDPGALALSR
jgi:hypothetical protein